MVGPWYHGQNDRFGWCGRDLVQSQDQHATDEDELRTGFVNPRSRCRPVGFGKLMVNERWARLGRQLRLGQLTDRSAMFRANRTLSRHRRMTESDPTETLATKLAV